MSSVADFPMVLPQGTKMPGGVMVPVSSLASVVSDLCTSSGRSELTRLDRHAEDSKRRGSGGEGPTGTYLQHSVRDLRARAITQ